MWYTNIPLSYYAACTCTAYVQSDLIILYLWSTSSNYCTNHTCTYMYTYMYVYVHVYVRVHTLYIIHMYTYMWWLSGLECQACQPEIAGSNPAQGSSVETSRLPGVPPFTLPCSLHVNKSKQGKGNGGTQDRQLIPKKKAELP